MAVLAAIAFVFVPDAWAHVAGGISGMGVGLWLGLDAAANQANGFARLHRGRRLTGRAGLLFNSMIITLGFVVVLIGVAMAIDGPPAVQEVG